MSKKPKGTLIIIGGNEREGQQEILTEVVKRAKRKNGGHIVVVTVATQEPEALAEEYTKIFKDLGAKKVDVLDVRTREQALDEANIKLFKDAPVIFFTGGDQLRITSQIGDSVIFRCMREIYEEGGIIVGTSAGAAAMPETMLIYGPGDESHHISAMGMAPGLGLVEGIIVDTHFAERGRIGRLIGAVSQNPRNLGLGIDEDTAIVVNAAATFKVLGSGAVYVLDGTDVLYSSLSEENPEGVESVFNLKLHVLAKDDEFDLVERHPVLPKEAVSEGQ